MEEWNSAMDTLYEEEVIARNCKLLAAELRLAHEAADEEMAREMQELEYQLARASWGEITITQAGKEYNKNLQTSLSLIFLCN